MKKIWILLIFCTTISITLLILSLFLGKPDDAYGRIVSSGVIKIGYAVEAPYAFVTAEGEITGESPETAKHVVQRLGRLKIQWIQVPFADLIPSLEHHRFDVIAAGLFVTNERSNRVLFSNPTLKISGGLLVRKDNPKSIGLDFMRAKPGDFIIATLAGSIEQERLISGGFAMENTLIVPDLISGKTALRDGLADGLVLSLPTLRWIDLNNPHTFEVLPLDLAATQNINFNQVAFAFNHNDESLQSAWNQAMSGWIGSDEHIQVIKPFGFKSKDIINLIK